MENLESLIKLLSAKERAFLENPCNTCPDVTDRETWKGHVFLPTFNTITAKTCYEEWTPREGDIFVVTYPKTGTIWSTTVISKLLAFDEETDKIYGSLPAQLTFLELGFPGKFSIVDKLPLQRRVFFTHLPPDLINLEKIKKANAKLVCVLRNPKDQIVSFYNFLQKIPLGKVEPLKSILGSGWDKYFEHVIAGDVPDFMKPGDWYPDHILSWYKYREDENFHLMYFEDMKKNLQKQVKDLTHFLEISVSDDRINQVTTECMFDQMKQKAVTEKNVRSKFVETNMRKGGVGGWKDYFTVSQSERIDAIMEEKLKDTDIKFTYTL